MAFFQRGRTKNAAPVDSVAHRVIPGTVSFERSRTSVLLGSSLGSISFSLASAAWVLLSFVVIREKHFSTASRCGLT